MVNDAKGKFWANASHASRKDARDAVKAARAAFGGWSGRTAYNRGQVVYRIAEVLEDRRDQFEAELRTAEGVTAAKARTYVDASIDRLVWYAGWADKIAQVTGGANPVAGPYFNHSAPEPSGVIAVVAPKGPLLGTGQRDRARHRHRQHRRGGRQRAAPADLDHAGRGDGDLRRPRRCGQHPHRSAGRGRALAGLAHGRQRHRPDRRRATSSSPATWRSAAAENLKRVRRPGLEDLLASPGLDRMTTFLETKTVWHPMGQC